MKIAILDNDVVADINALKALTEVSLSDLDIKLVNGDDEGYIYYKLNIDGDFQPDDAAGDTGWWVKRTHRAKGILFYTVDDSYDFEANNATDKTSILNMDEFCAILSGTDEAYVREQIRALIVTKTYAACTDDEKKAGLRRFCAGEGNDYIDALYTQAEYISMYRDLSEVLDQNYGKRDAMAFEYIQKQIYQGVITQARAAAIGAGAEQYRAEYRKTRRRGLNYGDTRNGVMDFIENTNGFQTRPVTGVSTVSKTVTISGKHIALINTEGLSIQWANSTANDGYYTIDSVSYNSGLDETTITVVEAIPDSTDDGDLYINGLFSFEGGTTTMRDETKSIYLNGVNGS